MLAEEFVRFLGESIFGRERLTEICRARLPISNPGSIVFLSCPPSLPRSSVLSYIIRFPQMAWSSTVVRLSPLRERSVK